eukprot:TRINITY_DN3248_c0_g1_i2.p1 TRINITY_DN3248_c0_g1~~TRINITY_DN3248_c0_g1_i2.p1  ORF type:complete len:215 (+),score=36.19 TRINITY_DN3248_c0_g1_i2:86-730(+)
MPPDGQKRMKKQHAGISSALGALGGAVVVAGIILMIVGWAWKNGDGAGVWEKGEIKVVAVTKGEPCEVDCRCARQCVGSGAVTDCVSELHCDTCEAYTYVVKAVTTSSSPCPSSTLTYLSPCSTTAPYIPSITPDYYVAAYINTSCQNFSHVSNHEPYATRNIRSDSGYLIRTGAIVAGAGALVVMLSLTAYVYSRSTFDLAVQQYKQSKLDGN